MEGKGFDEGVLPFDALREYASILRLMNRSNCRFLVIENKLVGIEQHPPHIL